MYSLPRLPRHFFGAIYRDVLNERYPLPACQPEHGTVQSRSASALSRDSCLLSVALEESRGDLRAKTRVTN